MCVLVSSGSPFARENVVLDQIDQRVSDRCSVIMESSACEFTVDFAETFGGGEPSFFPQFLYDALAGFRSGRRSGSFRHQWSFFEFLGYGGEQSIYGGLELILLTFYFELNLTYLHLQSYRWFGIFFCQFFTVLIIVLYILYMHNT